MPARIDLSGKVFGKLTVIKYLYSNDRRDSFYLCKCDCGNEKIISGTNLNRTAHPTRSCGCLQVEQIKSLRSEDPDLMIATKLWKANYSDGCSLESFIRLSQLPCFYCGATKSNKYKMYNNEVKIGKISQEWFDRCQLEYNGIDRVDSSKPHSEDNIVPCCYKCNIAKSDMTIKEFKEWIEQIYKNFIKGNN